ncbi:nuclear transport factor 2 family protein [Sphingobacterium corticibacterium]|nr:nuclear transport factor 2 family protein [Sphingobacterium corticibacterium]
MNKQVDICIAHSPIFLPQLPRNAGAWSNRYSVNLPTALPLKYQITNRKNNIHSTLKTTDMRTTLKTIAAALIMVTSLSSFASEKANPLKDVKSDMVIGSYVDAVTVGSIDLNKFLFADDFQYSNVNNNDRVGKKEYIKFLKANKGNKYDCKSSYEVLSQDGKVCVAKATMAFDNFTRVDYITLNQGKDGWKVSKVETTYP